MKKEISKHKWLIIILSLALLLRVIYLVESFRDNPTFFTPIVDSYTYDKLAVARVWGAGMGPESTWQPLFYPHFLSLFYFIFGRSFLLVSLFQILLGLGTCLLTYHLGKRLFSYRVGLIAAFLISISGPLIFYEGELLPTTWAVFWFLLSLTIFLNPENFVSGGTRDLNETCRRSQKENEFNHRDTENTEKDCGKIKFSWEENKKSLRSLRLCGSNLCFLALGAVCGIGITIRPNITLFYITGFLWLLFQYSRRSGWKRTIISGSSIIVGLSLILVPVLIRNYNLTRHWILMPVSGGLNFYIGNNPEEAETIATRPGESWHQLTVLSRKVGIFTEPYGSRYFYGKTYDYIREDPVSFAKGLIQKTVLFFNGREIPRNIDIYLYRRYSRVLSALVWRLHGLAFPMGIILPTAFLGIIIGLRRFRRLSFLYLFLLAYSFSVVLFFVTSRYRLPLLPVLCIFSASGISWFCRQCKLALRANFVVSRFNRDQYERIIGPYPRPGTTPLIVSLVLLTAFFIFCNLRLKIPEDGIYFEAEMYRALGSVYMEEGAVKEGIQYLEVAAKVEPGNADAHNLLGSAYLSGGRIDEAIEEFQQAITRNPEHSGPYKNLGMIFKQSNKIKKAKEQFLMALRYNAGDEELHQSLAEIHEKTGNIHEAVREYWTVLRLKPDHIPTRKNLARILGGLGDWETARELIAEAVRHEPRDVDLRCDLGMIYGNMRKPEAAIKEFQEALRLQPNLPVALLNLGIIYAHQGKKEKAEEMYQRLRRVDEGLAGKLKQGL